ncbi:hypothetical protein V7O66_00040 [Methanolobus sp. ZRKC3]|uniref:hypothetical protein n=1 Tax=Methanolobus sp. ZRKC3 TaxID=3125786 RepID=UPI00324499A7
MNRETIKNVFIVIAIFFIFFYATYDTSFNYKADKNTERYHNPSCPEIKKIKLFDLKEFEISEDAINAGYKPCEICNPAMSTTKLKITDNDRDSLTDYEELYTYNSNPLKNDTDGDSLNDDLEVYLNTSCSSIDTDWDGATDYQEYHIGTDPTSYTFHSKFKDTDSDDDKLNDYEEIYVLKTDPFNRDTDGDGLGDFIERFIKTNPRNPDTDGNGINDRDDFFSKEETLEIDTDNDGINDSEEERIGTDPAMSNYYELKNSDRDSDGVTDYKEIYLDETDPINPDTDKDGLTDGDEAERYTDPFNSDTDGDGLTDGEEVLEYGTDPRYPTTSKYDLPENKRKMNTLEIILTGAAIIIGDVILFAYKRDFERIELELQQKKKTRQQNNIQYIIKYKKKELTICVILVLSIVALLVLLDKFYFTPFPQINKLK